MAYVPGQIQRRRIDHFAKADLAYGVGVARGPGSQAVAVEHHDQPGAGSRRLPAAAPLPPNLPEAVTEQTATSQTVRLPFVASFPVATTADSSAQKLRC